jgi:hypothetical protein
LILNLHGFDKEGWAPLCSDYLDLLLARFSRLENLTILPLAEVLNKSKTDNPEEVPEADQIKLLKKGDHVVTNKFENGGKGFYLKNCGFSNDNTSIGTVFKRKELNRAPKVNFSLLE